MPEGETGAGGVTHRADGSANNWWLRSVNDTTNFRNVNSDGTLNNSGASNQNLPCA